MSVNITVEEILTWPQMKDVVDELNDPRFGNRTHGRRGSGCKGPLCKKAERDHQRRISELRAKAAGRTYTPRSSRIYDRDALLELIFEWHRKQVALRRAEAS